MQMTTSKRPNGGSTCMTYIWFVMLQRTTLNDWILVINNQIATRYVPDRKHSHAILRRSYLKYSARRSFPFAMLINWEVWLILVCARQWWVYRRHDANQMIGKIAGDVVPFNYIISQRNVLNTAKRHQ